MRGMLARCAAMVALLIASTLSACAQTRNPEQIDHYAGVLYLKGNAPFIRVVLEENTGKQWELIGIDQAALEKLQNRQIEVWAVRAEAVAPLYLPRLSVRKWFVPGP